MKYIHTSGKRMKDIAVIEQGHLFRKGIHNLPRGNIHLIQPKDVNTEHNLRIDELHKVKRDDIKESSILRPGDVIIKTKAPSPVAFRVDSENGLFAVTDHFMIIRISDSSVNPDYLRWFLNSRRTQIYLKQRMGGTNVPFLRKTTLEELTIPIPTSDLQAKIAALSDLIDKEKELTGKLITLRKSLAEQLSYDTLGGEWKDE
ncbi:MAG TPA: restriction endonuclease subunit S [Euryarchaeota archaeon]|nr:restriction endonuclease subunit S [Euryarchaeota archaeon]